MSGLTGQSWIGGRPTANTSPTFSVLSRADGSPLEGVFACASLDQADSAVELAAKAFRTFAQSSASARAALLRAIADQLELDRDALIARACHETALPEGRIAGEIGRTCGQLRFFASIVKEGLWNDARTDAADPARAPIPKPALRSELRPLGPVVVFGASNFPLAFSVAGGDTASALAAGCPVIVKGHPAHPGTSELAAQAIVRAVAASGLPAGVFSFLVDNESTGAGERVLRHPALRAGGFTGSRRVGVHLWRMAQSRPRPIPFFAEMGSVNPVVLMPGALEARGEAIAQSLAASATLGVGQFCTNPGVVLVVGSGFEPFAQALAKAMQAVPACPMLTEGIAASYRQGVAKWRDHQGVTPDVDASLEGAPALFSIGARRFMEDPMLHDEVFGPATLLVRCADMAEATAVLGSLEGQLTATLHAEPAELAEARELVWAMEQTAGRLILNQFPTGVEVCDAMVHGGPFPASSDDRTTSVGGRAILRWVRPIAFQAASDEALESFVNRS